MGIGDRGSKVLERDTGWRPQVTLGMCLAGQLPGRGGKSKNTFLAPVGIGLALFIAELAGESGSLSFLLRQVMRRDKKLTGYDWILYWRITKPSEKLRPSVAGTWFPGYHWIYWVGPFFGRRGFGRILSFREIFLLRRG